MNKNIWSLLALGLSLNLAAVANEDIAEEIEQPTTEQLLVTDISDEEEENKLLAVDADEEEEENKLLATDADEEEKNLEDFA